MHKKVPPFKVVMKIMNLILATGLVIFLILLVMFLSDYEQNHPRSIVENYFKRINSGDYSEVESITNFTVDKFNSADDFKEYINNIYPETEDLTFYEERTDSSDDVIYNVYSKENEFITEIKINKVVGKSEFGFTQWEIEPIKLEYIEQPLFNIPGDLEVYFNGKLVDELVTEGKDDIYAKLKDQNETPVRKVMTSSLPLLLEPVVEFKSEQKYETKITTAKDNEYRVDYYITTDEKKDLEAIATDVAKTYVKFISKGTTRSNILSKLYQGSEFYDIIRTFQNWMYNSYSSASFENIKNENTVIYSPHHFSSDISFKYILIKSGKEIVFDASYQMVFIKVNEKWLCSDIIIR